MDKQVSYLSLHAASQDVLHGLCHSTATGLPTVARAPCTCCLPACSPARLRLLAACAPACPPARLRLLTARAPASPPARSWVGRVDEVIRQLLSTLRFREGLHDGLLLWWASLVGMWALAALAFPE